MPVTAYVTQLELTSIMPLEDIRDACADGAGEQTPEEVWDSICQSVSEEIDGLLAPRYTHPFPDPVHPRLKTAARWITLETLFFRRRMMGDANPATVKADAERKALREIGTGKVLLDATAPLPQAPAPSVAAAAVTTPTITVPGSPGRLMF